MKYFSKLIERFSKTPEVKSAPVHAPVAQPLAADVPPPDVADVPPAVGH